MVNIKDFADPVNEYRSDISWCSNNSVRINVADFEAYEQKVKDILKLTMKYSDPDFIILDNIQHYGRLADPQNSADDSIFIMCNPCAEACLNNAEMCNLSEVFLDRCSSLDQCKKCLRYTFFYCKVVSMMPTYDPESDLTLRPMSAVRTHLSFYSL